MEDIYLSVIIPVYNTEKYIEKCLDSVIKGIKKVKEKCEIIIVNDGSSDNCENIIKTYLSKNLDLIKYIKKENAGLADTKNVGIKKARGKYLSFIDSDDYIDENFYLDAINNIKKEKADMIIYDFETIDIENNKTYVVEAKNNLYKDDKWGCIDVSIMPSSCNKIVKKELFKDLEFPKGLRYEDLGTTLILFFRAKKIKYICKPYYKYFIRSNSIMRANFDKENLQIIDIFNILFERIENLDISQDEKDRSLYMIYTRRLYEFLLENMKNLKFMEKYRLLRKFCDKIYKVDKKMNSNMYFRKNVYDTQSKVKRTFNHIMHFLIINKKPLLLALLLNKKIYYSVIHIKYSSMAL